MRAHATLAETKAIRNQLGGTVNDVVLAAVTRGFRDLFETQGEDPTKHRILATSEGRGHPIAGHPYKDVPDPSAPGKTLSCLSCHDPHVGNGVDRLKEGKIRNDFCSRCH